MSDKQFQISDKNREHIENMMTAAVVATIGDVMHVIQVACHKVMEDIVGEEIEIVTEKSVKP